MALMAPAVLICARCSAVLYCSASAIASCTEAIYDDDGRRSECEEGYENGCEAAAEELM